MSKKTTSNFIIQQTDKSPQEIRDMLPKYVVLAGSRGAGKETEFSDWDYFVPENRWKQFKKWAISNIGSDYDSGITGHISYRFGLEPKDLHEFSYLFELPRKKKRI